MFFLLLLHFFFFFFNDTATTEIYTLSLHDALPISLKRRNNGDAVQNSLDHGNLIWLGAPEFMVLNKSVVCGVCKAVDVHNKGIVTNTRCQRCRSGLAVSRFTQASLRSSCIVISV